MCRDVVRRRSWDGGGWLLGCRSRAGWRGRCVDDPPWFRIWPWLFSIVGVVCLVLVTSGDLGSTAKFKSRYRIYIRRRDSFNTTFFSKHLSEIFGDLLAPTPSGSSSSFIIHSSHVSRVLVTIIQSHLFIGIARPKAKTNQLSQTNKRLVGISVLSYPPAASTAIAYGSSTKPPVFSFFLPASLKSQQSSSAKSQTIIHHEALHRHSPPHHPLHRNILLLHPPSHPPTHHPTSSSSRPLHER